LLALLCVAAAARGESVGNVTDLYGSLLVRRPDGAIKVLALGSRLEQGDALVSRPGAYARLSLADRSEVTLGPDSELTIERYSFHDGDSRGDAAVLKLDKGQVRIVAGALGRRGQDGFTLSTPSATVEVHDSTFIARYVTADRGDVSQQGMQWQPPAVAQTLTQTPTQTSTKIQTQIQTQMQTQIQTQTQLPPPSAAAASAVGYTAMAQFRHVSMRSFNTQAPLLLAQNVSPNPGGSAGLNPGLYVQVLDGAINVSNSGGTQNFAAGQFGYTPSLQQPPIILPANPGLQFTPPPSFSTTGSQSSAGGAKPGAVDCVVR
jgi:hypothetical protein